MSWSVGHQGRRNQQVARQDPDRLHSTWPITSDGEPTNPTDPPDLWISGGSKDVPQSDRTQHHVNRMQPGARLRPPKRSCKQTQLTRVVLSKYYPQKTARRTCLLCCREQGCCRQGGPANKRVWLAWLVQVFLMHPGDADAHRSSGTHGSREDKGTRLPTIGTKPPARDKSQGACNCARAPAIIAPTTGTHMALPANMRTSSSDKCCHVLGGTLVVSCPCNAKHWRASKKAP